MRDPAETPLPLPTDLADLALEVADEAAALLDESRHGNWSVDTKSSSTDMVTEMDRRAEALIVERLLAARPDDGLLGEEGADRKGTTGVRWVFDPLDGTTNYLYDHPGWSVAIGATFADQAVAGAVVVPSLRERYWAAQGAGARDGDRDLTLGPAAPLALSLVGTGFGYDPARRVRQAEQVTGLIGRVRDVRRMGAAAADLCAVARGRLDAFYEVGLSHWDHCAGGVVAREAGARVEVVDLGDAEPVFAGASLTVAAHPDRFEELWSLLASVGVTPTEPPGR